MTRVNSLWFKNAIKDRELDQKVVADRMHMDPAVLSRIINGTRPARLDEAAELARVIGAPLEEILEALGISSEGISGAKKVPVVGWIDHNFTVHYGRGKKGRVLAEAPPMAMEGVEAVRYQTANTKLDSFDGSLVYYVPANDLGPEVIGKWCIVELADGKKILRLVKKGYKRGMYNLVNMIGLTVEEDVWIEKASPVVWMKF